MGFLLWRPRVKAEVDVGAAQHGAEADGGGEDYEEESAEQRADGAFLWVWQFHGSC